MTLRRPYQLKGLSDSVIYSNTDWESSQDSTSTSVYIYYILTDLLSIKTVFKTCHLQAYKHPLSMSSRNADAFEGRSNRILESLALEGTFDTLQIHAFPIKGEEHYWVLCQRPYWNLYRLHHWCFSCPLVQLSHHRRLLFALGEDMLVLPYHLWVFHVP